MTQQEAEAALTWLRAFLDCYEPELLALARGRYALGCFLYPTGPMFKKSRDELAADIAEEIADAIVYASQRLATDCMKRQGTDPI